MKLRYFKTSAERFEYFSLIKNAAARSLQTEQSQRSTLATFEGPLWSCS